MTLPVVELSTTDGRAPQTTDKLLSQRITAGSRETRRPDLERLGKDENKQNHSHPVPGPVDNYFSA